MNRAHPPGWAEALLRLVLAPRDVHTVSGDLLEEYGSGSSRSADRVAPICGT